LTFDTLKIINTKLLTVNSYFASDLPSDFNDEVLVGVPAGGRIQPVPQLDTISPIRNVDADFNYVSYQSTASSSEDASGGFGFIPGAMWFWNMNEWGEPTGRYFGAGGGAKQNGYQIFRERNQIQLTETFTSPIVVLKYISDGQNIDNATEIDTKAFATINAFIVWKTSPNRDNHFSPEGVAFNKQKRLLRARLNDMDKATLVNILRDSYRATSKS
jgi:hypothetical protein